MNSMQNPTTRNPSAPLVPPYSYPGYSPMAATVVVIVLVIFFLVLFALFARKFFSSVHSEEIRRHRSHSPSPPRHAWRLSYYSPPVRSFGLDPSLLRAMPVRSYRSGGGEAKEGCVVCLQAEFGEGEKMKAIAGCGHAFHPACIDGWLLLHGSCPICRCSKICFDDRGEEEEVVEVVVVVEEEEEEDGGGEEERKVVAIGRSRSLCWRVGQEGRGGSLRRAYSA